ncbi:MAG: carbonic anhydrase [Magnetococcales bacterium]|nr:carbonic anhydrase [Magnetococcales bacterium]
MCDNHKESFIQRLTEGHHQFLEHDLPLHRGLFQRLSREGQDPRALVIACSDSRIHPNLLTRTGPGDLFIVRNVANMMPPDHDDGKGFHGTSAALEYAVTVLEVEAVIVLGHSRCGGVQALANGAGEESTKGGFINPWLNIAHRDADIRAVIDAGFTDGDYRALEEQMVVFSLKNLRTYDFVREREEAGKLELHGWYFHIAEGRLHALDQKSGRFQPL